MGRKYSDLKAAYKAAQHFANHSRSQYSVLATEDGHFVVEDRHSAILLERQDPKYYFLLRHFRRSKWYSFRMRFLFFI
jgi:hypothetical protein